MTNRMKRLIEQTEGFEDDVKKALKLAAELDETIHDADELARKIKKTLGVMPFPITNITDPLKKASKSTLALRKHLDKAGK